MINQFGKWKVFSIESGDFRLDGGAMMGSVPKVLWEKTNPCDNLNRINLSLRCLLIDDGINKVLIETGMGNKLDDNFINMFHVRQSMFPLKDKLNKYGYQLEDINHVILTHLHFDHAGGATVVDQSGRIKPAFPNAKYYISKKNWQSGLDPNPRDRASYIKENYLPLEEYKCIELVNENTEIIDGISTINVDGHTFGQQLIKINGGDQNLVFCSDLIPLKSHLQLPWIMGYDLNALKTLEEKKYFLNIAADNKWWIWFYHDPLTVAVRVVRGKKYFDVVEEILRNE